MFIHSAVLLLLNRWHYHHVFKRKNTFNMLLKIEICRILTNNMIHKVISINEPYYLSYIFPSANWCWLSTIKTDLTFANLAFIGIFVQMMGQWYVIEIIQHLDERVSQANDVCPKLNLYMPSTSFIRLDWHEKSGDINYNLKMVDPENRGFWMVWGKQTGLYYCCS